MNSRRPDRAAAAAMGLVAGIYVWLAFALLPPATYWSVDNGYKRIQAGNIRLTPWLDLSIAYPGRTIDPNFQFVPFGYLFHYVWQGQIHLTQPPAIAVLSRPFIDRFGDRGELVVPVLSGLAIVGITGHLAKLITPWAAWIAVLLSGLATPILFYSMNLWEHTLAVALALAAVAVLEPIADEENPGRVWRFALSGLLAGLAGGIRKELLLLLGLVPTWLAWRTIRGKRWHWPLIAAWAGAACAVLSIYWGFALANSGNAIPPEFRLSSSPGFTAQAYILKHGFESLAHFVFGPEASAAGNVLILMVLAYSLARRLRAEGWRECASGVPLGAFALGVWWITRSYFEAYNVYGVLNVAPFLVLAIGAVAPHGLRSRQNLLLGLGFWILADLGIGMLTAAGPRHSAQEWGARFVLIVFPLLAAPAACALHNLWTHAPSSWPARLHLTVALGLVALSLRAEVAGLIQIYAAGLEHAQAQRLALALPEQILVTNLEWAAPQMPGVYADKQLFLLTSSEAWADFSTAAYANGVRRFAFISIGIVDPAVLVAAAPPGTTMFSRGVLRLSQHFYATQIAIEAGP